MLYIRYDKNDWNSFYNSWNDVDIFDVPVTGHAELFYEV